MFAAVKTQTADTQSASGEAKLVTMTDKEVPVDAMDIPESLPVSRELSAALLAAASAGNDHDKFARAMTAILTAAMQIEANQVRLLYVAQQLANSGTVELPEDLGENLLSKRPAAPDPDENS